MIEPNYHLIKEMHNKLCTMNLEKSRRMISRVLHVFRDQIDEDDTDKIISMLPPNLLLMYFSSWQKIERKKLTHHLDYFVNRVIAYDRTKKAQVFHTEIDALRATIIVLSCLDKHFHILDFLPLSVKQEILSAQLTEAA